MKERETRLNNVKKYAKIFFKVAKPHRLILIITLLLVNTFAWFIYSTRVDTSLSVHVSAWNVLFEAGDSPIVDYVDLNIDEMYPGMEDYVYELEAHNKSDVAASLHATIISVQLFGQIVYTQEGIADLGLEEDSTAPTSEELYEMMSSGEGTGFPFNITMGFTFTDMDALIGESTFRFVLNWPYEGGSSDSDYLDTIYGKYSAKYKEENPTEPSMKIKIKLSIVQELETTTTSTATSETTSVTTTTSTAAEE